jgi:hypothetical protein
MAKLKIKGDDKTITVRVRIAIRKRGGRKLVISPDGSPAAPASAGQRRIDDALVKAMARAFRWQELLENGTYATITEIAETEKINETYVGRILRLTLLAPHTIEMVVSGRNPLGLGLANLTQPFPVAWNQQAVLSDGSREVPKDE